jgi:hypothetical protein
MEWQNGKLANEMNAVGVDSFYGKQMNTDMMLQNFEVWICNKVIV